MSLTSQIYTCRLISRTGLSILLGGRCSLWTRPHARWKFHDHVKVRSRFIFRSVEPLQLLSPARRSACFRYAATSSSTTSSSSTFSAEENKTVPERIVQLFPSSFQPYLRLSRIHRPIGTWLLFWPCTWGLVLGAHGMPPLTLLTLFGLGAFIMRGAGCTINDMWDRDIDSKVKRTVDRPLAAGQLRMRHAIVWLGAQLSLALVILFQLTESCFMIGVGSLALVTVYPLAKRVTNWPQGVLGLTFNTGALMGFTAMHFSPDLGYLAMPWLDPSCLALYLAGLSWTLVYDTIYAHQDLEDDTLLGLGSTAKKFGENTKYWLSSFSVTMLTSLSAVGWMEGLKWPYYLGLTATAAHLAWQIRTLDIHSHKNCSARFKSNRHIGWIIFLSLASSY